MAYKYLLKEILEELDQTRNALSVEAKVRPGTILDLYDGKTQRIELKTFSRILDALNQFAIEKGLDKRYTIDDIIKYEYDAETSSDGK